MGNGFEAKVFLSKSKNFLGLAVISEQLSVISYQLS
jgi:hypothetical protein